MSGTNGTGNGAAGLWGSATNANLGANNPKGQAQSGLDNKLAGFTYDGRNYIRTGDGRFVDIVGDVLDGEALLRALFPPPPPPPDNKYPWIYPIEQPVYVDWAALDGTPVPKQEWIVPGWIPRYETTGLGGAGGEGKTLLVQQQATAGAIYKPWMNIKFPMFKSFLVLCEDREGDVRRRQEKINRHYDCSEADLADNMRVMPRRRSECNYLMIFDRDGVGHTTSFFDQLLAEIKAFHADLVVLDTKADVFFGNQNDENQARTFVRKCTDRIAEEAECAVILIYHPSRSGMKDGTGQSGNVQWDAAFRGRLVLTVAPPVGEGENAVVDEDARVLTRVKSNYARRGEEIGMRWEDGVFVCTDQQAPSGVIAVGKKDKADRVFRQLYEENRTLYGDQPLSNLINSSRYAPKVFAAHPHSEKVTLKEFEGAMQRALLPGGGFQIVNKGTEKNPQWQIAKVVQRSA